jgi:hypothetical protein
MSKDTDDAIKRASDRAHEYQVHGYDRQDDGYGGPYHPDAFLDPQVQFALGGDPEAQEKFTKDLRKLDEAKAKDGVDKVDVVAGSAHSTVVQEAPYRAAAETPELKATHDNVEEAAARKHLVVPRSDESEADAFARVATNAKAADAAEGDEPPARRTTADDSDEAKQARQETDSTAKRTAAKKPAAKKAAQKSERKFTTDAAKKSASDAGKK